MSEIPTLHEDERHSTRHVEIEPTWTFKSKSVASGFDHHVREQLPWYDIVTKAIVQIARHYIPQGGHVYDVGASNGNIGRALATLLTDRAATLTALEASAEMVATYGGPGRVIRVNAEDHEFERFDLAVVMLALMFVTPSRVEELLSKMRAKLNAGGAIVVVERMLPPAGYPAIIMSRLTLAAKLDGGAAADEILAKELSLAGVQRPLNPDVLGEAVEWFRFGDFAGYVIEA